MDPEEQHQFYIDEWRSNVLKNSDCMSRIRYSVTVPPSTVLDFKVYMQIWQDDDWDYTEFLNYCKKLTAEQVELNTSSYKSMADQLYLLIATEMPGRNIWICINHNDIGITIKYEQ